MYIKGFVSPKMKVVLPTFCIADINSSWYDYLSI